MHHMCMCAAATIGFNTTAITTSEGASATACVQVMRGQRLDRNIVFSMTTADGSAMAGLDYDSLTAELSFNPINAQQLLCMTVDTTVDSMDEANENFFIDLITNSPQVSVNPSRITVTILDNELGM